MNAVLMRVVLLCAMALIAAPAVAGVDELPEDIRAKLYKPALMDPNQPRGDSAYRDFIAKNPPPWKIGYVSSYAGNNWRAAVMDRLQNVLIPKWKELGLVSEVVVTQSNLNDATQIQQIRQLVHQSIDAVIVCCLNPTALNGAVEYAYNKGVAAFSGIGYLTSPCSDNSSTNFVVGGRMMGEWMANEIGGKGTVLNVEGIPGASASDSQNVGIEAAMAENKDIEVKRPIAGMWTDEVAQAEIQKWQATNPGKLDGIIIQSASELGALRASAVGPRHGSNHHRFGTRRPLLLAQKSGLRLGRDPRLARRPNRERPTGLPPGCAEYADARKSARARRVGVSN